MPIIKSCAYCGKEIKVKPSHEKEFNYCSSECKGKHMFERTIIKIEREKNINLEEWLKQKYLVEKVPLIKIGQMLGVSNRTPPKLLKYYNIPKYSQSESIKHQWIDNDDRRIKQSEFFKSMRNGDTKEGSTKTRTKSNLSREEFWSKMKIIMQSEEYRRKQSISKMGKKNGMYGRYGNLNPAYNPNLTLEDRIRGRNYYSYRKWRSKVYERDNYTCQCCGDSKGHNLQAHHMNCYSDFPTQRSDVNNGVTLCIKCHKLFHSMYGFKHNTKEQFNEFIDNNKY